MSNENFHEHKDGLVSALHTVRDIRGKLDAVKKELRSADLAKPAPLQAIIDLLQVDWELMIKNQRRHTVRNLLYHGLDQLGDEYSRRVLLSEEVASHLSAKERSFTFDKVLAIPKQDLSQAHLQKLAALACYIGCASAILKEIVLRAQRFEHLGGTKQRASLSVLRSLFAELTSIKSGKGLTTEADRPRFVLRRRFKVKEGKAEGGLSLAKPKGSLT